MSKMLEVGTIYPSQSPWWNAVVLVCKKYGDLQFHIDFHKLNVITKKDSYPVPQIQEAIESLVGAGYFSSWDLKAGFWQIAMDKASKQYTAFIMVNLGFFECKCMPFGLCNALATFQRFMQNCLGELNLTYSLIYLDDIILSFWRQRKSPYIACALCLSASESTIWSSSQASASFCKRCMTQ